MWHNDLMSEEENNQHEEQEKREAPQESVEQSVKSIKEQIGQEMSLFFDVPLNISVVLGTSQVTIKDLLQLQIGSVIEVDKLAGEPLEILINNKEIARGEVLVINENYGIRLTDIIDPVDNDVIKQR